MPKSHEVTDSNESKKTSSKCHTLPHLDDKKLGKGIQFFNTKNYAREEYQVKRWKIDKAKNKRMRIEHQCGLYIRKFIDAFIPPFKNILNEAEDKSDSSSLNYSISSHPSDEGSVYFTKQMGIITHVEDFIPSGIFPSTFDNSSSSLQNHIENIMLLIATLANVQSWHGVCSAILLYSKSYVNDSVAMQLINFIYEGLHFSGGLDELRVETQAGFDNYMNDVSVHSECMKSIQKNWDKVKHSPFFPAVSRLLGLLVTLNLYKLSDLTFRLGEHKLFEPDIRGLHNRADNIIDAILNTIVYFSENIAECISKRSIKPFFISETAAESLDEQIARVISWWPLVRQGNFSVHVKEDESVFRKELEDVLEAVRSIINRKKGSPFEIKLLKDKFEELLHIHHDYLTYKTGGVLRRAPFALELFGNSSQGKTVCGEQLICALLSSAGIDTNKDRHTVFNAGDKYESNHKTDTTVIIMDDIANAKKDSIDYSPAQKIIEYVNNQPLYAVKAELADKGKCWIEPYILLATTNVKDLDAFSYSNCPYSVQRRMNYILTIAAKDEYCTNGIVDSVKINKDDNLPLNDVQDIWNITVERAAAPNKMCEIAPYVIVEDKYGPMKDVSMSRVTNFLCDEFLKHKAQQEKLVQRSSAHGMNFDKCGVDGCLKSKRWCAEHNPHVAKEYALTKQNGLEEVCNTFNRLREDSYSSYVSLSNYAMRVNSFLGLLFSHTLFERFSYGVFLFEDLTNMRLYTIFHTCVIILYSMSALAVLFYKYYIVGICILLINTFLFWLLNGLIIRTATIRCRPFFNISRALSRWRRSQGHVVIIVGGAICLIYKSARLLLKYYNVIQKFDKQGMLRPLNSKDIATRDLQDNPWQNYDLPIQEVPMASNCKNIASHDLHHLVRKNLMFATTTCIRDCKEHDLHANILFIKSNVILLPTHYFELSPSFEFSCRKPGMPGPGTTFTLSVERSNSVPVKESTDLSLVYVTGGGSFKDLTKFFPLDYPSTFQFMMDYVSRDRQFLQYSGTCEYRDSVVSVSEESGEETLCKRVGMTLLSTKTFRGLCGAIMVSEGSGRTICGVHTAGVTDHSIGVCVFLIKSEVDAALNKLMSQMNILVTGSGEVFTNVVFDKQVLIKKQPHSLSVVRRLTNESHIQYHGCVDERATVTSNVRVSKISYDVIDVCGVPNKWMPAKMRPHFYGYESALINMNQATKNFPTRYLNRAIEDYLDGVKHIMMRDYVRDEQPLTHLETINGKDGVKFIDAMNMSTAIGYPLNGPKKNYIIGDIGRRDFKAPILEEIDRVHDLYKSGSRAFTIAKACKKDEIVSKEKCRIFYSNPIALTYLVRKYFLPIVRIIQMHPLDFECAVGINTHSPEWEEFDTYVTTFSQSNFIAGDYGKYDQRMSSQMILSALWILIEMSTFCNYSDEDRRVMRAMCGDIVYSYINFDGNIISLSNGGHISGNSLTVIINSIVGSLNMRVIFFMLDTNFYRAFRDYVALMTYGDDNIGSTRDCRMTIERISTKLADYGWTYTMPDKNAELEDYVHKIDFLKRTTVYCPEKDCKVGALHEDSIFKMLHNFLYKKTSPVEDIACALNIDTALREWANYGRSVYEKRRTEMKEIARRHDLSLLCRNLTMTYDQHVLDWKSKYKDGKSVLQEEELCFVHDF